MKKQNKKQGKRENILQEKNETKFIVLYESVNNFV